MVGGFSAEYFMYAEDMDLCLKIRRAGLRVYFVPRAEIVHHSGASSSAQGSKFSTVMTRRGAPYLHAVESRLLVGGGLSVGHGRFGRPAAAADDARA